MGTIRKSGDQIGVTKSSYPVHRYGMPAEMWKRYQWADWREHHKVVPVMRRLLPRLHGAIVVHNGEGA